MAISRVTCNTTVYCHICIQSKDYYVRVIMLGRGYCVHCICCDIVRQQRYCQSFTLSSLDLHHSRNREQCPITSGWDLEPADTK